MKRSAYIFTLLAMGAALASCVQEEPRPEATDPVVEASQMGAKAASRVSTLTFDWYRIHGVNQYGYTLVNTAEGTTTAKGITRDNSMTFSGLNPGTTYELTVQAFSTEGGVKRQFTLSATTDEIVPLETPEGLASTAASGGVLISWMEVYNAEYYKYVISDSEGNVLEEGQSTGTSVNIKGYSLGEYGFKVSACSDAEEFSESPQASLVFSVARKAVKTKTGLYERYDGDELVTSDPRNLVIYDDGTWAIKAFYGAEGYDFEFSPNEDGTFEILNAYHSAGGYHYVSTGVAEPTEYVAVYLAASYAEYVKDDPEYGSYISFYYLDSKDGWGCYDVFSWDVPSTEEEYEPQGDWVYKAVGTVKADDEWAEGYDAAFPDVEDIVVEAYADYVIIRGFSGVDGYDLKITYDEDENLTSLTPIINGEEGTTYTSGYASLYTGISGDWNLLQPYLVSGYGYAGSSADEKSGYLLFSAYGYLADGSYKWIYYYITWEARTEVGDTEPWSVTGRISGLDGTISNMKATLEHDGSGNYAIRAFAGNEGFDLMFTVNPGKTLHFTNGKAYKNYQVVKMSADNDEYFHQDSYSSFAGKSTEGSIKFKGSFYGDWTFIW